MTRIGWLTGRASPVPKRDMGWMILRHPSQRDWGIRVQNPGYIDTEHGRQVGRLGLFWPIID